MARKRQVTMSKSSRHQDDVQRENNGDSLEYSLFNLNSIKRRICAMSIIPEFLTRDNNIDPGKTDAPMPPIFQSSGRYSVIFQ